ncbi:MAG: hypothetical protein WC752_01690 [Patescibacteria group bacterium]|jgi:hypothetical protein
MDSISAIAGAIIQENGNNPFAVFWFLIQHGALIFVYPFFVKFLFDGWLEWTRGIVKHKRKYVLLSVNVPKDNEQSMKAVEQMFTHIYGVKQVPTFTKKYWGGWSQPLISFEIESDGGYIQFYIRCWVGHQDIIEAAVYAQYPDAEIKLVDKEKDYTNKINLKMLEDGTYDLYGSQLLLDNPDIYPIRGWRGWEHPMPGKFIDPLAAVLEMMSRMQPGEHFWYQIMTEPEPLDHLSHECQEQINKVIGEHKAAGPNILDKILDIPVKFLDIVHDTVFGGVEGGDHATEKPDKRIFLVEYEREMVTELDMKRSRWPFKCKVRYVYFAKKEMFNIEKAHRSFMGAIRQYKFLNNFHEGRWTTVDLDDTYWFDTYYQPFQKTRLFWRKRSLMRNYKMMDMERGEGEGYAMNTEELASLYHFPQIDVRAPFVQKAESRRMEPPTQLNLEQQETQKGPKIEVKTEVVAEGEDLNISTPVPKPAEAEPKIKPIIIKQTDEQIAYHEKLQREQGYKPMDNVDGTTAWPEGETPDTIEQPIKVQPVSLEKDNNSGSVGGPPPNLPVA